MAELNSVTLLSTWRALSSDASSPGWRTIDLFQKNGIRVKVAKHAPGNEEAVLIGFSEAKVAPTAQLPQGQGFRIERITLGNALDEYWLTIIRQPAGGLELFATVVTDVCGLLSAFTEESEQAVYQLLLGRVRGWQEFMRKGHAALSLEEEQGLVGELFFLKNIIEEGLPIFSAVEGWKGPLGGLHDFELGTGAIEIKSTMKMHGFPVKIVSLDQLDDAQFPPLFISALRLKLNEKGTTLPELISALRCILVADCSAAQLFEEAVLQAGYLDMHLDLYTRKFELLDTRIHQIDAAFPRLTRNNVPSAICQAQYELDLASISAHNHSLTGTLEQLGVL
jgi:hypothetical protein